MKNNETKLSPYLKRRKEQGFIERPNISFKYLNSLNEEGMKKLNKMLENIDEHNKTIREFLSKDPSTSSQSPKVTQMKKPRSNTM